MKRITLTLTTAMALLLLAPHATVSAQSPAGTITGVVTDQTNAPMQAILVKVMNRGLSQQMRTDEKGEFRFVVPQKKGYTLTAEFKRFNKAEVKITKINVSGETRIVVMLPVLDFIL